MPATKGGLGLQLPATDMHAALCAPTENCSQLLGLTMTAPSSGPDALRTHSQARGSDNQALRKCPGARHGRCRGAQLVPAAPCRACPPRQAPPSPQGPRALTVR